MATHDYNIENQGFPAFRTDLNNVLTAINTSNSGTSRPTSAVAGTIWLDNSGDATAHLLKFFDGTDDILLGTINTTANTIDWADSASEVSLTGTETLTNKTLTSPKINEDVEVTSTATELNLLDGVTSTTAELNILDGVTSTAAELNILDGVTSTADELNILDGVTSTATELNYSDLTTLGTTAASKIFTADANNLTTVSGAVANVEDTLTDEATITWNVIDSPVAKVTLGGNRTLSAPSGTTPIAGQFVSLLAIQDGTGGRTITWNAAYEFTEDTAPDLTATASKGDLFTFRYNGSKWLEVGRNLKLTLS